MQSYTEIPDTLSLTASRAPLLNNDKTVMSCHSGTAFPTTNLQVGMLCLRTDQMKMYQLKDLTPTWVFIIDLDMFTPFGQFADLQVVDLNTIVESGWYHQNANANTTATGAANYPTASAGLLRVFSDGSMTYQFYSKYDTGEMWVRAKYNTTWGAWRKQWDSANLTNNNQLSNGSGFITSTLSQPLDANDQELRKPRLDNYKETVEAITVTLATTNLSCNSANVFHLSLQANTTLAIIDPPPAGVLYTMTLILEQDATGSRTVTLPTARWPSGAVPTITPTATKVTMLTYWTVDGGATWFGVPGAKDM